MQVGRPELPGYGGMAAPKPGYRPETYRPETKQLAEGEVGQSIGYVPDYSQLPQQPISIPNNFWGYVMLVVGMR